MRLLVLFERKITEQQVHPIVGAAMICPELKLEFGIFMEHPGKYMDETAFAKEYRTKKDRRGYKYLYPASGPLNI